MTRQIQTAVLSLALLLPGSAAFAQTHHHYYRTHDYTTTRGAIVGSVAGAVLGHGVKGALVGAAVGDAVQYERNREARHRH